MTKLIGGIGSRTQIIKPGCDMDLTILAIEAMIEMYHDEWEINPTTIIYGREQRETAISILHALPVHPVQAICASILQQVYYIPHLGYRWGVLGVEGMAMTEGA